MENRKKVNMEVIKLKAAEKGSNSDVCSTLEYSFKDKDIDFSIAEITGRYPNKGYTVNHKSKELIYVIKGCGTIFFESHQVEFNEGDCVLIEPNEKYYWLSEDAKVALACTPAWSKDQYEEVE